MTVRGTVRAALTEERSKAEISLGFAVSRRDRVLLPLPKRKVARVSKRLFFLYYSFFIIHHSFISRDFSNEE